VIIHEVVEGVDRALVNLVRTENDFTELEEATDILSDTLLSHLSYEDPAADVAGVDDLAAGDAGQREGDGGAGSAAGEALDIGAAGGKQPQRVLLARGCSPRNCTKLLPRFRTASQAT
jgi:hypothetical protein